MAQNILIDKEFQALIPPLSAEEKQQLEANIAADGCRDPLVLWPCETFEVLLSTGETQTLRYEDRRYELAACDGEDGCDAWQLDADVHEDFADHLWGDMLYVDDWPHILIDGHNRYEICTRLDLPFQVVCHDFNSRDDATEWIINNQFGRRNLSDYQRGVLALRMKPIIEARADAARIAGNSSGGKSSPISDATPDIFTNEVQRVAAPEPVAPAIRTDTAVASLANLGKDTIRKIEQIEKVAAPEVKEWAAAGEVSINLAAQFVALPEEVQQEAIAAIAEHHEPAKEVMREAVHNHRAQGTGENEWYTPQTHLDAAYEVLGNIDLDPASSEIANKTVQADRIFTIDDDGLTKEWAGRVWMNPPYAQPFIAQFVEKLASEYEAGRVTEAISLTHNYTDTVWFHRAAKSCAAICFTRGRIGFLSPEGKKAAPTQGQAFFYYGSKVAEFVTSFSRIGFVVEVRNV